MSSNGFGIPKLGHEYATEKAKTPDVILQVQNIAGRSSEIEQLLNDLERRLTPVLRPSAPAEQLLTGEPEQTVPLAAQLRSIDICLFDSIGKLESILRRIEV